MWDQQPPTSARVTLQNYVKRLRQALGERGRDRVRTHPGGYSISVDDGELDVSRFWKMADSARAAGRDGLWDEAEQQASAALALWRGEPLTDVESEALAVREVPRLAELRLQALEARLDAKLHLGWHAEAVPALQRLVHYRILAADPALTAPGLVPARPAPEAADAAAALARLIPRQLPGIAANFTGRAAELAALDRMLKEAGDEEPGTVVISAIGGTAGVGNPKPGANTLNRYRPVT